MVRVIYIKSETELPENDKFVLVMFGPENNRVWHSRGLTATVKKREEIPDQVELLAFHTAVEGLKGTADREGIQNIYAIAPNLSDPAT